MTRARMPRPHEVAAAKRDPRLLRAFQERQDDGAWRTRGLCQSVDPETFFPAPSEPADTAIALCRTCDVQGACLAWALDVGDCHGVWGGTTPRERRAMLIAWRTGAGSDGTSEVTPPVPVAATAVVAPVRMTRRLGLVPEQRGGRPERRPSEHRPAEHRRTEKELVERVAS